MEQVLFVQLQLEARQPHSLRQRSNRRRFRFEWLQFRLVNNTSLQLGRESRQHDHSTERRASSPLGEPHSSQKRVDNFPVTVSFPRHSGSKRN